LRVEANGARHGFESQVNPERRIKRCSQSKEREDYAANAAASTASARELHGLPVHFTKAELRRAWVRFARLMHPDLWHGKGDGVAKMKEAALKRGNQARDELLPQAGG
jgi:hypothetical protein